MKGYKATYNMKCQDHLFEVGKTYETKTLKMCESGFHFCPVMKDVMEYYNLNFDFILLEVEALGNIQTEKDKCATDKIKILRVVPKEEYVDLPEVEWDEKGKMIHYKDSDGFEYWSEYDKNGREIHYKDSDGYEEWREYGENGKMIYYKNSNGYGCWKEYGENGKMIHYKNSDGYEWKY